MRITQGMLSRNMLQNVSSSYAKLGKYMDQLQTGSKINRPSDDPVVAMKGINYRDQVAKVQQHLRNTNEIHTWMDSSDLALDKATKALERMKELAVKASNGVDGDDERQAIKKEVVQLKEQLETIANTEVNGKYIFSGSDTTNKLVTEENGKIVIGGNSDAINIEVADGITLKSNVDGKKLFSDDFFGNITDFIGALDDGDSEQIEKGIDGISDNITHVVDTRADLGARMNRLELIEDRLDTREVSAKKMMSENEDIDYEKVITELITQQSVHRAALAAGSKIIQPTLVDFLH